MGLETSERWNDRIDQNKRKEETMEEERDREGWGREREGKGGS